MATTYYPQASTTTLPSSPYPSTAHHQYTATSPYGGMASSTIPSSTHHHPYTTSTTTKPQPSPYTIQPTRSTMGLDRGVSEIGERRRVKSVILEEEFLGPAPEEQVRYVEVPYVEEVVRHVPRREIVEVEKRVPKYEYEWVDRVVEVPQIQYIEKTVEVPQVHEVVKHVPRREVVEVPREVVRHIPKIETKVVEKAVEVPGEIIEVPKPYTVENKIMVPQHIDKEVPMIVCQTLRPVLTESNDFVEVDVVEYEPEMIPVDIHVPRAVQSEVVSMGVVEEQHRVVQVPPAQYNSMLRMLNPHIADQDSSALPFVQNSNGTVAFLGNNEKISNIQPMPGVEIEGWRPTTARGLSKNHRAMSVSQHTGGGRYEMGYRSASSQTSASQKSHQVVVSKRDRGVSSGTHTTTTTTTVNRSRTGATEKRLSKGKKARGVCPC